MFQLHTNLKLPIIGIAHAGHDRADENYVNPSITSKKTLNNIDNLFTKIVGFAQKL